MDRLESRIDTTDSLFSSNRARMLNLVHDLRTRTERVREGGGQRYVDRHRAQGKLTARERIDRLIAPGTPLLELSALAANGVYDDEAPGAGLVTAVARVSGQEVVIVANDATVKGGTYF